MDDDDDDDTFQFILWKCQASWQNKYLSAFIEWKQWVQYIVGTWHNFHL